ncbi:MAG: hypothetical protein H6737_16585 [Alphaproteobacteria bacterium]|nr:hypothetical protein [Alphaproteobacteria bacterium]
MSDDHKFLRELDALGLGEGSYRAILLLPLIEVAWADNEIQKQERDAILSYGEGNQLLAGPARKVVEDWLTERPTQDFFDRGREVLVRLAHKPDGFGREIKPHQVDDIVEYCDIIAESAGGLFGMFFQTSNEEQEAIRNISNHIARLHQEHYEPE